ncbi:MAG: hypothetical protein AAFQ13_09835, partial [Pseudomonadota bacterium]
QRRIKTDDAHLFHFFQQRNATEHLHAEDEQRIARARGKREARGAAMMVSGTWSGEGVFNMEEMDPDPFMDMLNQHGLPWQVKELNGPVGF